MRKILITSIFMACCAAHAEVCNVKIVTDANPDYYDMPSMIHSITSKWPTPKEKCWAMFYWNHFARRQTTPMEIHGLELADPICQFNDYGYTQCSTISGINCGIWYNMGLTPRFHDVILHTVAECEYDGAFHMYDNSLSALYTLCDGKTLASVADLHAVTGCALSGGKQEAGHYVLYHCLTATSPRGLLIGSDTARSLKDEVHVYSKDFYRNYYFNWDWGHRYTLNLKDGEVYTRYYYKLDDPSIAKEKKGDPKYFVPNPEIKGADRDPESTNRRYHQRGNGVWKFVPSLSAADYQKAIYHAGNITAKDGLGLHPEKPGALAEIIYLVQTANVAASQTLSGTILRKTDKDNARISISTTNGLHWKEVWKADGIGDLPVKVDLIDEVSGGYEILVKIELQSQAAAEDAALKALEIDTRTMLNAKTNSRLTLGKNTVYVGAGDQTESIVIWPDLRGDAYKDYIVEERNIVTDAQHTGWHGVLRAAKPKEDAWLVYRINAPNDLVKITYGGRFYPRAGHLDLMHSVDGGKTWITTWTLKETKAPWDVIHYETAEVPKGTKSILIKYLLNSSDPGAQGFGIYALRMEANYLPMDTAFKPVEVTYTWDEVQSDYSRVEHSHTQLVEHVPFKYTINVSGDDVPVMKSLRVNLRGSAGPLKYGYGSGKDPGGEKFIGRWMTLGSNLALNKPYTTTIPSGSTWGAGDPEGKKLTDGIVGPSFAGGPTPTWGVIWSDRQTPEVTIDLGKVESCGAFRIHLTAGWPWWDAMKGEIKDQVEVFTSTDGKDFVSRGNFDFRLHYRDIPVNVMLPDDETATGWNFPLVLDKSVQAQYVKYKIAAKRQLVVTELEVYDSIKFEPFDLKLALPDEKQP